MLRPDTPFRSARSPWIMVVFFTLLYMISFVDRYILVLLAKPVQSEFALTDSEFGILVGPAFAVLYSLIGFPLAQMLDIGSRLRIVAGGVILWSLCTIGSAFVGNFTELAIARAGVAVGEAVLTPALISLIFDMFEPEDRDRPTALYVAMGTLMTGGSFILGGYAFDLATILSSEALHITPWRLTMIIVGAPGILLAILLLATQKEPARRKVAVPETSQPDTATFLRYMLAHWKFYLPFYLGIGIGVSIGLGCLVWLPAVLSREFGYGIADAGKSFGLAAAPAAAIGTITWTWVARRLRGGKMGRGPVLALIVSVFFMGGGAIVLFIAGAGTTATLAAGLIIGGSAAFTVLAAICSQMVGPPLMQARLAALNLIALNILGSGLGPVLVPMIAGSYVDEGHAMRLGIVAYSFGAAPIALVALAICLRYLPRQAQQA